MLTSTEIVELLKGKLITDIESNNLKAFEECIDEAENKGVKRDVVNGKIFDGLCFPLHFAVILRRLEMAGLLLKHGADINAKDSQGETPLRIAVVGDEDDFAMIKLLICNDADVNASKYNGMSLLSLILNEREWYKNAGIENKSMEKVLDLLNKGNSSEVCGISTRNSTTSTIVAANLSSSIGGNKSSYTFATAPSSAVKPSSFINSVFSWVGASTTATLSSLFRSTLALLPAQQSVAHSTGSPIGSSQVDFNRTALLADVMIRKFTGKRYSRPLDDSLLTIEEIKERRLNAIERDVKTAINKFEKT